MRFLYMLLIFTTLYICHDKNQFCLGLEYERQHFY